MARPGSSLVVHVCNPLLLFFLHPKLFIVANEAKSMEIIPFINFKASYAVLRKKIRLLRLIFDSEELRKGSSCTLMFHQGKLKFVTDPHMPVPHAENAFLHQNQKISLSP